jgi:hypothetical protein
MRYDNDLLEVERINCDISRDPVPNAKYRRKNAQRIPFYPTTECQLLSPSHGRVSHRRTAAFQRQRRRFLVGSVTFVRRIKRGKSASN